MMLRNQLFSGEIEAEDQKIHHEGTKNTKKAEER